MAVQDKTDFRWNGKLSGAVNNLYYDLINVDVVHTPYSTMHRNSSFFLKTRPGYVVLQGAENSLPGYDVTDLKIIWDDVCTKSEGNAFVMAKKGGNAYIFATTIHDGCSGGWVQIRQLSGGECRDWKLFTTDYVKGDWIDYLDDESQMFNTTGHGERVATGDSGIQINQYNLGTTIGLFSDENVESEYFEFKNVTPGDYLLVYSSNNGANDGFSGQVRMITGVDSLGRLTLDSPRLGFKTVDSSQFQEGENKEVKMGGLQYAIFSDWGEVLGYSDSNNVYIMPFLDNIGDLSVYQQDNQYSGTNIIGVTSACDKIFVLTDNGYVHYANGVGYNKFFINDDMFAGTDKSSIIAYKDIVICFGVRHISVGVPDDNNMYWTMYNQSSTIGTRSRYSYSEYDGDLLFVSNDRRLLALGIANNVGKYMLQHEDVGAMLNSKLSTLVPGDEVFVGEDNNDLRVFVQTKTEPYTTDNAGNIIINRNANNSLVHIYKFNKLFQVRTEDHIDGLLLSGARDGVYYGQDGLYVRNGNAHRDVRNTPGSGTALEFETKISAYLIENENNGIEGQPDLFTLAKLNRLITTLGPGKYSENSKIHIQSYRQGIGVDYEFNIAPEDGVNNVWVDFVSKAYNEMEPDVPDCMKGAIQDSQSAYEAHYTNKHIYSQSFVPFTPRCNSAVEMLTQDHAIRINDTLYRFAPTMPLVTNLGENQNYSTQIKIELISGNGDVVCFGGWLAELFIAPIGTTGPDGEYELSPETEC